LEDLINAFKVLVGKPEGKRQLERHRRRWENNIKINLQKTSLIHMAQDVLWTR